MESHNGNKNITTTISLARKAIEDGQNARKPVSPGQQQLRPLRFGLYYPDSRMNCVTSQRGNSVIAAWSAYESSRFFLNRNDQDQDWFGSKVDGPLWLSMGVDKVTGRLRPPVANIPARLTGSKDLRGATGTATQVVNNFVTVQSEWFTAASFSSLPHILSKSPQTMEIPLGETVVREIVRNWVTTDNVKKVHKPMMLWTLEERSIGRGGKVDRKGNKNRQKLYSRAKVISVAFLHALLSMPIDEYQGKFSSLFKKGQSRKNYEISSKYVEEKNLMPILKCQQKWIDLAHEAVLKQDVQSALQLH